jgi:mannose-1-phosphate guanylyltransferase
MDKAEKNLVAVIMAGGMGTRFWPLSTSERPKQFVRLFDDRSLLQKSYDRIIPVVPDKRIFVLTNQKFTGLVKEQIPDLPDSNIIGEPERKDTAAAVCLGALIAEKYFGDPVMVVLTADHLIEPEEEFQRTLLSAAETARETGALYTFGIKPTHPSSSYGYLELGERTVKKGTLEHFQVLSYREKPDVETARRYLQSGRFLWNSGMFVWTAKSIIAELSLHLPQHVEHIQRAVRKIGTAQWKNTLHEAFSTLRRISIDFAVMEKAGDVRCVCGDFHWKDVGGWLSMPDFLKCDKNGNHFRYSVRTLDAAGNILYCQDPRETLAVVGLDNILVVRAGGKTLVADKDRLEDVKRLVESMQS